MWGLLQLRRHFFFSHLTSLFGADIKFHKSNSSFPFWICIIGASLSLIPKRLHFFMKVQDVFVDHGGSCFDCQQFSMILVSWLTMQTTYSVCLHKIICKIRHFIISNNSAQILFQAPVSCQDNRSSLLASLKFFQLIQIRSLGYIFGQARSILQHSQHYTARLSSRKSAFPLLL